MTSWVCFLGLSQHKVGSHERCTWCYRDPIKDTPLVKVSRRRYKKKKKAPFEIQTHDLIVLQSAPSIFKSLFIFLTPERKVESVFLLFHENFLGWRGFFDTSYLFINLFIYYLLFPPSRYFEILAIWSKLELIGDRLAAINRFRKSKKTPKQRISQFIRASALQICSNYPLIQFVVHQFLLNYSQLKLLVRILSG